jgi:hypothetical protein
MKNLRLVLLGYSLIALVLFFLFSPPNRASSPQPALAQGAPGKKCPDIVRAALNNTNKSCAYTTRNKACYGNSMIEAQGQASASNFTFAKPGDVTDISAIKSLKLSAYDASSGNWGIALLRLQGDLPDTATGQNVTAIAFGDVQVTDSSQTASENVNAAVGATNTLLAPTIQAADTLVAPTRAFEETMVYGTYCIAPQTQVAGTKIALTENAQTLQAQFNETAQSKVDSRDATAQARLVSANPTQQQQATNNALIKQLLSGQHSSRGQPRLWRRITRTIPRLP